MRSSTIGTSSMDNGRYRLTGQLGAGGMAVVYSAFDTKLKVKRAIKVLNEQYAKNDKVRQRFLAEAQTMAQLRHPNIVTVYDIVTEGETPFIVMELVQGGSLHGYITKAGSYTAPLAARLIQGALLALQFSHDNGVVHRDFKPHNVLLTLEGVPKLTDFGVAQVAGSDHSLTKTGAVMGTLAYMAPEQRMNAKSSGVEVDVFSVGSSLYSMIKGSHSFDLYSTEFHNRLFEGLEAEIREVIVKACQYESSERYSSASAMSDALAPISKEVGAEEWKEFLAVINEITPQEFEMEVEGNNEGKSLDTFALDDGQANADVILPPSVANETMFVESFNPVEGEGRRTRSVFYLGLFLALGLSVYLFTGQQNVANLQRPMTSSPAVSNERSDATPLADSEDVVESAAVEDGVESAAVEDGAAATVVEVLDVESIGEDVVAEPSDNQAVELDPVNDDNDNQEDETTAVQGDSGSLDTSAPIDMGPVNARINTRPLSQLSIDGEDVGSTSWSGELSPGEHTLEMTARDGRVHQTEITVISDTEYTLCWDFDSEGPCSRSRRVREPNRRRNRDR
jgi:serine/threonine protein kinase